MGNPALTNRIARDAAPVVGSYICDEGTPGCPCANDGYYSGGLVPLAERHCWHESTRRRLAQCYGEPRANRIALGIDAKTQADIARWNALGSRKAVAAA